MPPSLMHLLLSALILVTTPLDSRREPLPHMPVGRHHRPLVEQSKIVRHGELQIAQQGTRQPTEEFEDPAHPDAPGRSESPPTPSISVDALREEGVQGFASERPGKAGLRTVKYGLIRSGWALPVEPGERIEFSLETDESPEDLVWTPAARPRSPIQQIESIEFFMKEGRLSLSQTGRFRLRVPRKPGNYPFRLTVGREVRHSGERYSPAPGIEVKLTLLVKQPFDRNGNGVLGDYPVGVYPNEKGRSASSFVQRHQHLYVAPTSLILATPEVESLHVSEHYTLGEFIPPMDRGKTSYLVLDRRLLVMLEAANRQLKAQFDFAGTEKPLRVLSAFLSPNHLMQLGAKGIRLTLFSRYQYGDAAAVIWDADGDSHMDDLTGDGQIDEEDARKLAESLGEVQRKLKMFGGIGSEAKPQLPHLPDTPYVDIDMRGVSSRW